jgi:predicted RNA-binding Zn-ribbon protein involved in translation (DUF1610 family)
MRIVPTLLAVLALSLSAAAQEMQDPEKNAKKAKHGKPPAGQDDTKEVKARWCEECKAFIDQKDLVDKHKCPRCNKVARKVDTSMVKVYTCAQCGRRTEEARECHGAPAKESTVRAAVIFKCETCGKFETHEGPCPTHACKKEGRMLVRTLELPHEEHTEK